MKEKRKIILMLKKMNKQLKIKEHFIKVLHRYLNNHIVKKEKKFLKYLLAVNFCAKCEFIKKRTSFYINQNYNADTMVILDTFFLYKEYRQEDEKEINELLYKILRSVNLSPENTYITYSMKCILKNNFFKNKDKYKEFFFKELNLVAPKQILIFGMFSYELFFKELEMKCNTFSNQYKYKDCNIFLTNNPVEIFNNTSLKKPVWEYLKLFKKECNL